MKGIMFNLLEAAVSRTHGEDAWDDLLEDAGLEGAYTSLGSYPDKDLLALVRGVAERTGLSEAAVLRWFGRESMPALAAAYPAFFDGHREIRTFVETLNEIIHPEVRKLYPGADVPTFGFRTTADGGVVLRYGSPRRLCALAEGLIEGAAAQFGQTVEIRQPECMHRGDAMCTIEVRA